MQTLVGLLRAVNVGGTGVLAMAELRAICEAIGFDAVRTHLQSGNVIFRTDMDAPAARAALEDRVGAHLGKPARILIRDSAGLRDVLARNPFQGAAPNQVAVLFVDGPPAADVAERAKGKADEAIVPGQREIFIHYPSGMGRSRLRLPAMDHGTARNLNTVAKLAEMASAT